MTFNDSLKIVEKKIAEGKTEQACTALTLLLEGKNESSYQQILLLTGQFNEIKRNQALGLDDDKRGLNRINNSLILMCTDAKKEFGTEIIHADLQQRFDAVAPKIQESAPSGAVPFMDTVRKWGPIVGALVVFYLGYKVYDWASNLTMRSPQTTIAQRTNEIRSQAATAPSTKQSEAGTSTTVLSEPKPVFLDFKMKSQNIEILETRLYPTDGLSRLVFYAKFFNDSRFPANLFKESFGLTVDGQEKVLGYNDLTEEYPKANGNGTIQGNGHVFVKMTFEIPSNAQSVIFQIKRTGKASATVDLKKTIAGEVEKPKLVTLSQEVDFKIVKNFSNDFKLLSVKVDGYDDNFFKVKARVVKCYNCDFYNLCLKIVCDNGESLRYFDWAETKEYPNILDKYTDKEYTFLLPRYLKSIELMVGNCAAGETPFKVPLPL
jgi:hypothetical protein